KLDVEGLRDKTGHRVQQRGKVDAEQRALAQRGDSGLLSLPHRKRFLRSLALRDVDEGDPKLLVRSLPTLAHDRLRLHPPRPPRRTQQTQLARLLVFHLRQALRQRTIRSQRIRR